MPILSWWKGINCWWIFKTSNTLSLSRNETLQLVVIQMELMIMKSISNETNYIYLTYVTLDKVSAYFLRVNPNKDSKFRLNDYFLLLINGLLTNNNNLYNL